MARAAYIGLTTTSTPDEAIAALRRDADTQFDPVVLDALAAVVVVAEPQPALAGNG